MMVNIHTRFGLPAMGTQKVVTHFIYNFIKNDKDDVIADVIPIAMGNAQGS